VSTLLFFWLVLKASLLSTSGMGNVPALHHDLVVRGWATDRAFAESLAIGQTAPGPSGLWVISLGYLTFGTAGALLALVAIVIPPLLVLLIEQLYARMQKHPLVEGFVRGLSLGVVGVFFVVLVDLLRGDGVDLASLAIAACAAALGFVRRVPVIAIVAAAAAVGVALYA
jgi:chromate transporter